MIDIEGIVTGTGRDPRRLVMYVAGTDQKSYWGTLPTSLLPTSLLGGGIIGRRVRLRASFVRPNRGGLEWSNPRDAQIVQSDAPSD